jgi:hypothetical protein
MTHKKLAAPDRFMNKMRYGEDQAGPSARERGRPSAPDYGPPDAVPKSGWRS